MKKTVLIYLGLFLGLAIASRIALTYFNPTNPSHQQWISGLKFLMISYFGGFIIVIGASVIMIIRNRRETLEEKGS